jgi:hypothetical protein
VKMPSAIRVQIPVGSNVFGLVIHPLQSTADLISIEEKKVVRTGTYVPKKQSGKGPAEAIESMRIEVSNFDQQIVVAINGEPVFDALEVMNVTADEALEATVSTMAGQKIDPDKAARISLRMEQQKRWAIGVSGGDVKVTDLEMFRDVFYTPGRRRHAIESDYEVPPGSYFVQGDNSPVSSDSRNWEQPNVAHSLLIGKPFLVHLPSRPAFLQIGGWRWPVRIPDWHRIRYIH